MVEEAEKSIERASRVAASCLACTVKIENIAAGAGLDEVLDALVGLEV